MQTHITATSSPSSIDMLTPTEVRSVLDLDETSLVDLINTGRLTAYRLGGHLRFRTADVFSRAAATIAA